uniref:Uncharacterized protein n=1 Tax=Tanacetum cinerariifolium TaxID=118510 RepID=A0A699HXT1_TANCI|nr:hypothetical protein [Tanacetum cinerariifolium]
MDLHADVAADVATTWQPLTHPLTGGQQPLTSVLAMVNGGPSSLTAAVDRRGDTWLSNDCLQVRGTVHTRKGSGTRRKVQYEDQKVSVPGVDPEGSRMPRCTLLLVDLDIDS